MSSTNRDTIASASVCSADCGTPVEVGGFACDESPARFADSRAATIARNLLSDTAISLRSIELNGNQRGLPQSQARATPLTSETGTPSTSKKDVPSGNDDGRSGMAAHPLAVILPCDRGGSEGAKAGPAFSPAHK